ncbi:MAG: tricarballylate dehydrogenase [Limisphaerales bacterium]|jgi:tricarballylate dehydrogenase
MTEPSALLRTMNSTDVLVIGGGHAALCAAISAAELGAKVTVLEAAPQWMRGGNSRHTRNMRVMHDEPTATLVGAYSADAYWQDLLRVTEGVTDSELAQMVIAQSTELLHWLVRLGAHFQPALSGTLNLESTNAFFLGGGKALLNAEYAYAKKLGVGVVYEAQVIRINVEGGRFRSAVAEISGELTEFTGNALVVASGGFQANSAWMREAWGDAADNFLIRGTPYNTGTVLKNLMDQGADTVGEPDQCHAVAIDARAPKYDGGIVSRLDCVCFSVVVNKEGQRFYDEGEDFWPKRYAIWGRLVAQQPGQIAYALFDDKVVNNFMPSAFPVIQSETLAGLAAQLVDVDSQQLLATVDAFNASLSGESENNNDPGSLDGCATVGLTPAKTNWARPIDTGPFYAYPLRPGITFTYMGLKVDRQARVHLHGKPVDNLFAAGEVMAGNILGRGYCAGTGMTIGGVFGRIAGKEAACQVQ